MNNRWFLVGMVAAWLPLAAMAGDTVSRRFVSGAVAVTNSQANSAWVPVAALVRFDNAAAGSLSVKRESGGEVFVLSRCDFSGATNLVWAAECEVPVRAGEVLRIETTAAVGGTVQVVRKAE